MQSHDSLFESHEQEHDFVLATMYVLDELSHEEAIAFEQRLGTEQSLRELVAEAVAVTHAIASTPTLTVVETARPIISTWSATSQIWAVAASLLLVLSGSITVIWFQRAHHQSFDSQQNRLAEVWIEHSFTPDLPEESPWNASMELTHTESLNDDDSLLTEDLATPPRWMIQALAANSPESTETVQ